MARAGEKTLSSDEAVLASLGYKQELKRDFGALELFGLAFSLIGIVPSIASVLIYALPNGGPVALVWGWAASSFFIIFVALAIAELGSSMPTSGGVYYWTYQLCSPRYRTLVSWLVGYINTTAYISGIAGIDYSLALQVVAAASIGSDLNYIPTTAQIYGVFIAILLMHCVLVSMTTKFLARMHAVSVFINIGLVLVFLIGIPIATPAEFRNSASFAFGHFENLYDWPNGFAFFLSFLAPLWSVGGFDSTVHISEEARNAKTAVPWAIVCAVTAGCILGFVLNIVIAFHMGPDVAAVLGSPFGQPMATILLNSFGKNGCLAIWSFIIIDQFFIGTSILTISSRQNFAFSRDGAFPFSRTLYHLNSRLTTPVYSVWVSGFLAALIGLLSFAGTIAVSALFTLGIVGQYVSDATPIIARFVGGQPFKPGPFTLGKFSLPVAIVAVAWMSFMSIVLLFPVTLQTNAQNMNYTVVVLGGVTILALAYYFFPRFGGANWFEGPAHTIETLHGRVDDADAGSGSFETEKADATAAVGVAEER
ncbi:amino acid/polyamine transporter I [Vararia minispora EC-137]|uniref:Amino acid/polyamine transporter I n=1 Tax=Vararia minispora EC-137 TaxID=1314806 RepID=A0ACB8QAJ1_9AGAM|nr:amino acid/polyamine transporter I [Vararia minispora EC-137]